MAGSFWADLVDRQQGYAGFTPELHAALPGITAAVIGAGGNGSVLDLLVRAGFCRFVIIDPDVVEATNLNRLPFGRAAVGMPKVEVWERHLRDINPDCHVAAFAKAVGRRDGSWLQEVLSGADLLFLGTTDVEANLVAGRIASGMGIRTIIGPASSGSCIVSSTIGSRAENG